MTTALTQETATALSHRFKEPEWLARLRAAAFERHAVLPWPHPSDEVWRRTDVTQLDPMNGCVLPEPPGVLQHVALTEKQLAQFTMPAADEALYVRADGSWMSQASERGVTVTDLADAARTHANVLQPILESDGLTPSEEKLASLNTAFHHDDCVVLVPAGRVEGRPIRLVRLLSSRVKQALFPLTVIVVGRGSSLVLIDEYVGIGEQASIGSPPVINSRVELVLEPQAGVHYVRIQRWDTQAHEFFLQRATLQEGAQLTMVNINFGARVSKTHTITQLLGPQASSKLYGFMFGHGSQHIDQHTLQDHQAPHTFSDLLYKAALKDRSRMIYTGLIRIGKAAKQTNAYQANHNLLLGQDAKAETIPMLEILADDVQCKHGATIGPVDDEQLFYLMTRGIPRELAERLLVMGFVEPIIAQIPIEALRQQLLKEVEGNLQA